MAAIDVGNAAIDRATESTEGATYIDLANPANLSGKITSIELWFNGITATGVKVGTFSGSGGQYTSRDVATIGNVTSGSKQTFSGLSINVVAGDFIGIFFSSGGLELDTTGGSGVYNKLGDQFGTGVQTYALNATHAMSTYGAGFEAPTVTTQAVTVIDITTATGNGNITDTGGVNATVRGVCWSTSANPTTADSHSTENGSFSTGAFTASITGLTSNTLYHVRAYATGPGGGPSYGSDVTFTTLKSVAQVAGRYYKVTISATGVTSATSIANRGYRTAPAAPTNVVASKGIYPDKVVITWTKSLGADTYHVWRDAVDLGAAGDVSTFDDTGAGAPAITPGTAVAADDASVQHISLSVTGNSSANGTTYTYKVVASNSAGNSPDSLTNTGYRAIPTLTYQWQRSMADSDATYSNISGGTTAQYDDTASWTPV